MRAFRYLTLCFSFGLALCVATGQFKASAANNAAEKEPLAFAPGQVIIDLNKVKWSPLKLEGFPAGTEFSLLRGDLEYGAELIVRVPPGYQVPNHNHTSDETMIWLQGDFTYINGADGKSIELSGQSFASLPGNTSPHSLHCGEDPCLFYLRFSRGFDYKIFPTPETTTKIK